MSEQTHEEGGGTEKAIAGSYILVGVLALSIGVGFLLGAGAGWILFGAFFVLAAATAVKSSKKAQP